MEKVTKLHCGILDDYQNVALSYADWSPVLDKVEVKSFQSHFESEEEVAKAVGNCEFIVIMRERTPFTASLFQKLPKLKLLITSGMRNASIDLKAAEKQGVTVCGTASSSEPPTEITWALILALARQVVPENLAMKNNGPWQSSVGSDLNGKQLGLLGLGKIGSKVAKVGIAFGMKVVAWSPNLTKDKTEPLGVQLAASKEALLETSDYVSIHLVLGDRSRGLLGAPEFKKMKKTAFLINTSRAPIVDEKALVDALRNGQIAGAGLDVFEIEPLPRDHVFRKLPNILSTPHLGYVSQSNYKTYYKETVEDIQAFLKGAPVRKIN